MYGNKYCSPVYSNNTKFKVNKYGYKYFELQIKKLIIDFLQLSNSKNKKYN